MKKIVALVLSLVMVMGLATTAFAATEYSGLYMKDVNDVETVIEDVTLTVVPAKAVKYDKVTGEALEAGVIAHYTDGTTNYVKAAGLADADVVVYADAACKIVKFYLTAVEYVEYYDGAVFTNFGEKCGQVDMEPAEKVTYYTVKGADFAVVAGDKEGDAALMVGGKLVEVNSSAVATEKVGHAIVTEVEDGEISKLYCGVCNMQAVEAANAMSVPKGADQTGLVGNWYWAGTAVEGEKVESAKTFDAGIAMYVGMSVMAAAGSAVVLKKKD